MALALGTYSIVCIVINITSQSIKLNFSRDYLEFRENSAGQSDDGPSDDHDLKVVNHVKGLLNEVIEAVATFNKTVAAPEVSTDKATVPTVIMVYDEEAEAGPGTSSTVVHQHSSSSYQNNTHLVLIEVAFFTPMYRRRSCECQCPIDVQIGES